MLLPSQIKPLLRHESKVVRAIASGYFHERHDLDPELVSIVAEEIRLRGLTDLVGELCSVEFSPTTPQAWTDWLWLWQTVADQRIRPSDLDTMPWQSFLARGLYRAPTAWARQAETEIREHTRFDQDAWAVIAVREEWATWSPERRWEHLQKNYAERWDEEDDYPRELAGPYVEMLVQEVAQSSAPTDKEILSLLDVCKDSSKSLWLEVVLVRLAGLRRLEAAIPRLVDLLGVDDDTMPAAAQKALVQIGTDKVVRQVSENFPGEEWSWQLYACGVLETIGLPSAEEALLTISCGVMQEGIEAHIASALMRQFSARGISVVRRVVCEGYDTFVDSLEDKLPAVAEALGIEFANDDEWQTAVKAREADRRNYFDRFRNMANAARGSRPALLDPDELDAIDDRPLPDGTIFRHQSKVGRNDPCTCGSGKKFKKCCANAVAR